MSYNPNFVGNPSSLTVGSSSTGYQNNTGSTAGIATAVSASAANPGQFLLTDVSNEPSAEGWLGLTSQSIPNLASGLVISDGRLENVQSLGFTVGQAVWVGSTPGTLTTTQPSIGVAGFVSGDFVLFVGVIVQNEFNPSNQDLQLCRQIIGQL